MAKTKLVVFLTNVNFLPNVFTSKGMVMNPTIVSVVKNAVSVIIPAPLSRNEPIKGKATNAGMRVTVPINAEITTAKKPVSPPIVLSIHSGGIIVNTRPINRSIPIMSDNIPPIIFFACFSESIVLFLSFLIEISNDIIAIPINIIVLILFPPITKVYNKINQKKVTQVTKGAKMINFFKALPLFSTISVETIDFIRKDYQDKSIIKIAGEANHYLAIVYKGQAVMQHIGIDGQTMIVASFDEGSTFGGNRLFCDNNIFPLTIFAKGDTSILYISKDHVLEMCQTDRNFLIEYLKDVANKSDILSLKIKSATFVSLEEQIIRFLTKESLIHQSNEFELKLSKKEWAEQLGVQRTSLSRALQRMKEKGWLSYKNHHYRLINHEIFKRP